MIGATLGVLVFFPVYQNTWGADSTLQLKPAPMDWVYIANRQRIGKAVATVDKRRDVLAQPHLGIGIDKAKVGLGINLTRTQVDNMAADAGQTVASRRTDGHGVAARW